MLEISGSLYRQICRSTGTSRLTKVPGSWVLFQGNDKLQWENPCWLLDFCDKAGKKNYKCLDDSFRSSQEQYFWPQFMLVPIPSTLNVPSVFHLFCRCSLSLLLTFFTHMVASVGTDRGMLFIVLIPWSWIVRGVYWDKKLVDLVPVSVLAGQRLKVSLTCVPGHLSKKVVRHPTVQTLVPQFQSSGTCFDKLGHTTFSPRKNQGSQQLKRRK